MKNCPKCGKPFEVKTSGHCNECRKESARLKRLAEGVKPKNNSCIIGNTKQCTICKEFKDFSKFSPAVRGLGGLSTRCKDCNNIVASKVDKITKRLYTQTYRDKNREWWKSLHRIHQFNRQKSIKAVSDGTVTKEFAESIYNTTECYYCELEIDKNDRTLEHKQPLNKGGLHSADNIVMACKGCNSAKRDKTEEEFKQYRLCLQVQE